jgi:hypothetical protein
MLLFWTENKAIVVDQSLLWCHMVLYVVTCMFL